MERRDFIKLLGATGLVAFSGGWPRPAFAQAAAPLYIAIHTSGGIDQSSWCDPKEDASVNSWAATQPAGQAGNIRFAPMAENAAFFQKYANDMLVINGIDGQTNGHGSGRRVRSTGRLAVGYPSLPELMAAIHGAGMPMAYLLGGGFSDSAGLAPFVRVPDQNTAMALADPNRRSSNSAWLKPADLQIMQRYRAQRLTDLRARTNNLPYWQRSMDQLEAARSAGGAMGRLNVALSQGGLDTNDLAGRRNSVVTQMHFFLLAADAGLSTAASFAIGGFDHHNDFDNRHTATLPRLTGALDYLWDKAAGLGLADRLFVHISSDVGRTPRYNSNNGKDHWSITSDVIMKRGVAWTNRVVGASGPQHQRVKLDLQTLQVDEANGSVVTPAHVHRAMRTELGIDGHALTQQFSLDVPDLDLFAPAKATV